MICDYGCGNAAIKTLKNGKHCCSNSTSSCPEMKLKNQKGVKAKRAELGDTFWKNGHPKGSTGGTSLKGKTYEQIYGAEIAAKRRTALSENSGGAHNWEKVSIEQKEAHASNARIRLLARYEAGWMPKAGRCKKIQYTSPVAGIVSVDGTWELAVAKWLDSKGYNWKRNTIRFPYTNLKGTLSHYTPDFFVEELGGYLEIKGYETDLDRCKWSQFSETLTVWKKKELYENQILV